MQTSKIETSTNDTLILEHQGARKILTLNGVQVLPKITRGDEKVGSTHPCSPIFNPDYNNLYGLNQHGEMRNTEVEVKKINDNTLEVNHTVSEARYPKGMEVRQEISLKEGVFNLTTTHTNTGKTEAAVLTGEHCYFDAPQGYVGTVLNGLDITEYIRNSKDGVPLSIKAVNTIKIPGKPKYILKQEGFPFVMLWVGTDPLINMRDRNYICIEPVEADPTERWFGSRESFIQPGKSRSASFSLSLA